MSYQERLKIFSEIEKIRGRPLITYMTSRRDFMGGLLGMDSIPEFCEHIRQIPDNEDKIDLLIASRGGDPNVAWRIINLLRSRFKKVGVLIPFEAHSAATLLAFGADEIIMHPFSCLSPIDAQITLRDPMGNAINQFSTDDVKLFKKYAEEDLGIDKKSGIDVLELLTHELAPTKIGIVKKSIKFTDSIAGKLLETHIHDKEKIDQIIEKFNGFSHHGYSISRKEAIGLGLPVSKKDNKTLDNLMWKLWEDAENEMRCKIPFNPVSIIYNDKEIMQRLSVPYSMINPPKIESTSEDSIVAIVESKYAKSYYLSKTVISATRANDLSIACNVSPINIGWKTEVQSNGNE